MKRTREQRQAYYLKTREQQIAKSKEYYQNNKDRILKELSGFRKKLKEIKKRAIKHS
jgi:hypothetical protein